MRSIVRLVKSCNVIVLGAEKPMARHLRPMPRLLKQISKIVSGKQVLKKFQSSPTTQRCFCGECGSPIMSIKADTPDYYRLRIGTLDTLIQQVPVCHIFVSSKAEWESIHDDLPQYAERP